MASLQIDEEYLREIVQKEVKEISEELKSGFITRDALSQAIKEIEELPKYSTIGNIGSLVEIDEVIKILTGTTYNERKMKQMQEEAKKKRKCGNCKYLDLSEPHSVGFPCKRPNHEFRTPTAQLKYKHAPACKAYAERGENAE